MYIIFTIIHRFGTSISSQSTNQRTAEFGFMVEIDRVSQKRHTGTVASDNVDAANNSNE